MTEKEFLDKYLNYLINKCYLEITDIEEDIETETDKFLEEQHKKYYEVEFEKILTQEEIEEVYQKGLRGEVHRINNMNLEEIKNMYKENS